MIKVQYLKKVYMPTSAYLGYDKEDRELVAPDKEFATIDEAYLYAINHGGDPTADMKFIQC
jgi:hypothetical protein